LGGQLAGGTLGDLLGRHRALGVGYGGVYPLSATLTAEALSPVERSKAIALAFCFQGVEYLVHGFS